MDVLGCNCPVNKVVLSMPRANVLHVNICIDARNCVKGIGTINQREGGSGGAFWADREGSMGTVRKTPPVHFITSHAQWVAVHSSRIRGGAAATRRAGVKHGAVSATCVKTPIDVRLANVFWIFQGGKIEMRSCNCGSGAMVAFLLERFVVLGEVLLFCEVLLGV